MTIILFIIFVFINLLMMTMMTMMMMTPEMMQLMRKARWQKNARRRKGDGWRNNSFGPTAQDCLTMARRIKKMIIMTIMRKKTKTAKLSRLFLLLQQTSKTHPIPGIFLRALNNQLLACSQLPTLEIPKKKTAQNSRR